MEFPDFFEKFPEFRDSLGISGGVRSTGKKIEKRLDEMQEKLDEINEPETEEESEKGKDKGKGKEKEGDGDVDMGS